MFNIGDKIVYGLSGIYVVEDICKQTVLGNERTYYKLHILNGSASCVYIPVDNEGLVSSMRYPITSTEAQRIISQINEIEPHEWYKDSRKRNDVFREVFESGDHRALISVIKALWNSFESRRAEKKKIYASDENLMRKAQGLLYSEFSLALGIPENEVADYIKSKAE